MTKPNLILASGSSIRAAILRGAGLDFEIVRPDVDESVIKTRRLNENRSLDDIAVELARAKCMNIAAERDGIVIGSDQILDFEGKAFDKPATMEDARARFLMMRGHPHDLINGTVVARDGKVIWQHLQRSTLTFRMLTEDEIDAYLKAAGDEILASVGAYQIEALGARLFEKIEGDHTAVLGLALLPLLALLRREGVVDF